MKKITGLILFLIFIIIPAKVFADFTFTTDHSSVNPDTEIIAHINLNLQGQNDKQYFLEGAFKKDGGSNYFGQTWNDSDWIKYSGSSFSNLKTVTTDSEGKWSGDLKVKFDTSNSQFVGNGNYTLQLKRFTSAGSSSYSDNSITITAENSAVPVTPTPTPISGTGSVSDNASVNTNTTTKQVFTIGSLPSSLDVNQSTDVDVTLNALANTNYYLKGAFFKEGSTNYFGKTKVGGNWVKNNQTALDQLSIKTDADGNWKGSVQIMPDVDDTGFTGHGTYNFKVGRYNSSGSSLTWSNLTVLTITGDKPADQTVSVSTTDSNDGSVTSDLIETANEQTPTLLGVTSDVLGDSKIDYQIASMAAEATASTTTDTPVIESGLTSSLPFYLWFLGAGAFLSVGGFALVKFLKSNYYFQDVLQKFQR